MKKALAFLAVMLIVVFACCWEAHAEDSTSTGWYVSSMGGIVGTSKQISEGDLEDTWKFEVVKMIYKNIGEAFRYWDMNYSGESSKEDYSAKTMIFGKKPTNETEVIPYLFVAGSGTHDSEDPEGRELIYNFDFGGGLIIPTGWFDGVVEVGAKRLEDDWLVSITGGLWIRDLEIFK